MTKRDCFEEAARQFGYPEDEILRRRNKAHSVLPFEFMLAEVPAAEQADLIAEFLQMFKDTAEMPAPVQHLIRNALMDIYTEKDNTN